MQTVKFALFDASVYHLASQLTVENPGLSLFLTHLTSTQISAMFVHVTVEEDEIQIGMWIQMDCYCFNMKRFYLKERWPCIDDPVPSCVTSCWCVC